MAVQPGRMNKLAILAGMAILSLSALAGGGAIVVGTLQWLGAVAPFSPHWQPQSLVVGGLFLGTPVAAVGWGLVWLGRWLAENG